MLKGFKIKITVFLLLLPVLPILAQSYLKREDSWVMEKMQQMTIDQKIGQLFIIRAYSRSNPSEEKIISNYIKKYQIGGLCFFQGDPIEQIRLINTFQQQSTIPLMMGMDAEWGLNMRFPSKSIALPKQLMMGATQDNKLIYEMGAEVASQCRATGIHINFAPAIDINTNPSNPVIYDRSFGESVRNVTAKGYMYMRALEDNGVMACLKHFPGHGDTDKDSHYELPVIHSTLEQLNATELYPFRRLISQKVSAVMMGHIYMPAIDDRPFRPASLSDKAINILRKDLGFNGLIITDGMDMKAITNHYPNGIAEAEAILAGNDIILLPENLDKAFAMIKSYIAQGKITEERLNQSVERILRAKYRIGLNHPQTVSSNYVYERLNSDQAIAIKQKIAAAAVTVLEDVDNAIPILNITDSRIATLSINADKQTPFQMRASSYLPCYHYNINVSDDPNYFNQLKQTLTQFDKVIVGIHTSGKLSGFNSELTPSTLSFLKNLDQEKEVIIVFFGSPYLAYKLDFAKHLIINYDNDPITQDMTMQAIFGASDIRGRLPVSSGSLWKEGFGVDKNSLRRLGFAHPEFVGLISDTLREIDNVMNKMIKAGAAPGGQVLVAKNGKIILQKSYGRLEPNGEYVNNRTIYDVASITKVLATTLSVMKLVERNKLTLSNPIKNYISGIDTTDKADLIISDILAHESGLYPWIGFYRSTLASNKPFGFNELYYSGMLLSNYTIPVAKGMFMRTDYIDSIYQTIWTSRLLAPHQYKYSDLGFYILQKVIENQSGQKLDEYAKNQFYKPLGLRNTDFNPIDQFPLERIAPTEVDNYWRKQTIRGYVHDMGAAMLGGVAGHAGLFSNSYDLAIMMQMLLNQGTYGGTEFFKPKTVELFTTRYKNSTRRGLGFDMKELDTSQRESASSLAPDSVFGHTAFTGPAVWADPENNIIFVFTTNRTFPTPNRKFSNGHFRESIQNLVYKAIRP